MKFYLKIENCCLKILTEHPLSLTNFFTTILQFYYVTTHECCDQLIIKNYY